MNTKNELKFGRIINRETIINKEQGIDIIAPPDNSGYAAAKEIHERLRTINVQASILIDPEHEILLKADRPAIIIGNLSNSKCVTYLYYKFLCITDLYYPGPNGYNLRTILDPFGAGNNIIHIGYSDDIGLRNALDIFLNKCNSTLPYFSEVCAVQLPCNEKDMESICKSDIPEDKNIIRSVHASYWWYMGYIAYMTGDSEQLKKYLDGWHKLLEIAYENPGIGNNFHLYSLTHVSIWRLLEHSGLIPDDMRSDIERCIYHWAENNEGSKYHHDIRGIMPSHNHSMFCAISLLYVSDFFKTHYKLNEADEWHRVAKAVFSSFDNDGWKPVCDDSSYAPNVSLPLVCLYSLYEDDHIFLNKSGKKIVNWLKVIIGQNLMIPSFGDGSFNDSFPGCLLMILSHYFKDGELRGILEKGNYKEFISPNVLTYSRMFDSGVAAEEIKTPPLVSVIPMDRYIYDIWEKNKGAAYVMTPTPPEGPYESCFDKLNIRTGPDINDEFLLIDGLGNNGLHAYSDAMGILDYSAKGIVWLIEEMCYQSEPEKCQIITITRNGYASHIPGYALLEEKSEKADHVYLRMRLKNYSGTDWVREIYFIKGLGLVCNDTVIANEDGEYVICGQFRTPSKVYKKDGYIISDRVNHEAEQYQMRLKAYSANDIHMSLEERYETFHVKRLIDLKDAKVDEKICNSNTLGLQSMLRMWNMRYHNDNLLTTTITSRTSASLKKGNSISMTHVFHITISDSENICPNFADNKIELTYLKSSYYLSSMYSFSNAIRNDYALKSDNIFMIEIANLGSEILLVKPIDKETFICTLKENSIVMVRKSKVVWKKEIGNEIHSIEHAPYDGGMLFIGWGENALTALDMNSNILWENKIIGKTTEFPAWEMFTPMVVCLKYGFIGNTQFIAAGCGDNFIRIYDMAGSILHECYAYATVPDVIELFDVDGDGQLEIMGASKTASSGGIFYIHDINGKAGKNINIAPWLCIFRSHIMKERDGKLCIACGMNYGVNFKKITIDKGNYNLNFSKNLGGTVSAIYMNDDSGIFYVGSSKGIILSFDKDGNDLWYADVESPVQDIFPFKDGIIVLSYNGEIRKLTDKGTIEGKETLPSFVKGCIDNNGRIIIYCGKRLYMMN